MQQASTIVEELAFQPVASRLAGLLLNQFQDAGDKPVARSLTLDQMAAHIGSTREMVCRLLYRFSDEDLIQITRTEFLINNKPGLQRLTGRPDAPV
jgi:CRP-like cAMP-binding protein